MGIILASMFSDCPALTSLTLNNCGIDYTGTACILGNENLEHLDLTGNPLRDEGACLLSAHPRLNALFL